MQPHPSPRSFQPQEFPAKLRSREAAGYLGISPSTLAKMRLRGTGPVYLKIGARVVVYDRADLDRYVAARRRTSTSDTGEAR